MEKLRTFALAIWLGSGMDEIVQYDNHYFEVGDQSYLVVTDSEAEDYWEEEADRYIDELILPEIPEVHRNYFDRDLWKADTKYLDGRGHTLNRYDGQEYDITVYEWENHTG